VAEEDRKAHQPRILQFPERKREAQTAYYRLSPTWAEAFGGTRGCGNRPEHDATVPEDPAAESSERRKIEGGHLCHEHAEP
jgi:hypothetical protein